jgi:NADH-quinone oxidoreductase subunit B
MASNLNLMAPQKGWDTKYADDGGSVISANVDATLNALLNWGRSNSIWFMLFGLACCAIELMQTGGPRSDLERFGAAPRPSPRSSDLFIIAGTLTYKMALRVKRLYDQMSEPRFVISMGSCSNCGGLFQYAYSVCKGVDQIIPVDIYVPGCPPRPEALLEGLLKIQTMIKNEKYLQKRYGVAV